MQRSMRLLVPVSRVTTAWTRLPDVVSTVRDDLGLRQVCGRRDPFAWVGAVLSWTEHRVALLTQMLGPEIYDKCWLGATRLPRYSLRRYHFLMAPTLATFAACALRGPFRQMLSLLVCGWRRATWNSLQSCEVVLKRPASIVCPRQTVSSGGQQACPFR